MKSFTLALGLFNHSKQTALSVDVPSYALSDWLESQQDEMTLECLDIDTEAFSTIKCLDDLVTLVDWLDSQSYIDLDQVADYLDLFSLSDLHLYDDMHTGCNDFGEYSQCIADDLLSCEAGDLLKRYFDYDAFERDLSYDYSIGRYVWRNC